MLATERVDLPADRMLGLDESENERKFEAVSPGRQALAASGGVCGPTGVDYSVLSIADPGPAGQGAAWHSSAPPGADLGIFCRTRWPR